MPSEQQKLRSFARLLKAPCVVVYKKITDSTCFMGEQWKGNTPLEFGRQSHVTIRQVKITTKELRLQGPVNEPRCNDSCQASMAGDVTKGPYQVSP